MVTPIKTLTLSLCLVLPCLALTPTTAHADHTKKERITTDTAYTLQDGEWRVGVWRVDYGLFESLDVGTLIIPWLLPDQARTPNLSLKYEYRHNNKISAGLRLMGLQTSFGLEGAGASLRIIPVNAAFSYRFNRRWTLSSELVYTQVSLSGDVNDGDFRGAAVVSNAQLTATAEYRWSKRTAIVVHMRTQVYQDTTADGSTTFRPDPYTTVEVVGGASTDALDTKGAWSVVPSFVWSWETFNLRAGLGYGNWSLPVVNFVLPAKSPILDLDLYWRW